VVLKVWDGPTKQGEISRKKTKQKTGVATTFKCLYKAASNCNDTDFFKELRGHNEKSLRTTGLDHNIHIHKK